jgi:hypothetical protein
MDSWVPAAAVGLYALVVVSFLLSIMAVLFAYRLSRTTGLFGAWALLIAGLALTSFEDFAFFGSIVFVSFSRVEATVEGYTVGTVLFAVIILFGIPALFFSSMYKLNALFRALNANNSRDGQRKTEQQPELVR